MAWPTKNTSRVVATAAIGPRGAAAVAYYAALAESRGAEALRPAIGAMFGGKCYDCSVIDRWRPGKHLKYLYRVAAGRRVGADAFSRVRRFVMKRTVDDVIHDVGFELVGWGNDDGANDGNIRARCAIMRCISPSLVVKALAVRGVRDGRERLVRRSLADFVDGLAAFRAAVETRVIKCGASTDVPRLGEDGFDNDLEFIGYYFICARELYERRGRYAALTKKRVAKWV